MPDLPGHLLGPQSKTAGFRFDLKIDLLFARCKTIIDIFYNRIKTQSLGNIGSSLFQQTNIFVAEFYGNGGSATGSTRRTCPSFPVPMSRPWALWARHRNTAILLVMSVT